MKRLISFVAAATAALVVLVAAEPAMATVHGKNGRIAFRRYFNTAYTHGAIFTINPDGTGIRQITRPAKGVLDTQPDWSPSGRWIAFERISPQKVRLFKVRADGSDLTLLLQGPCSNNGCAPDADPAWSPSGKQIAFDRSYGPVVNGTVAHLGLFVMHVDGTHLRQLTEAVTPTKYEDTSPQWAPDGTHLVFQRWNKATDRHAVFTVRLDGTHPLRLSPWSLDAGGNPDWSPDGRWIMFQSHEPHDRQDNLYLVHPNGKDLHRITHTFGGTYTWFKQTFSPDGTMITVGRGPAFGAAGNPDIYVMNLDGSDLRDITNSPAWDSASDWGPKPTHRLGRR